MIIQILNWMMFAFAITTSYLAWMIYSITKAKSLLYIFAAMVLGAATRIVIAIWGNYKYSTYPSFVFWVLWTIGLYLLLRLLTKYIKSNGMHDAEIREEGKVEGKAEGKAEARLDEIKSLKNSLNKVKKGKE